MLNWCKKRLAKWLTVQKSEEELALDEKKRLIKGVQEYITLVDEVHSSLAKLVRKRLPSNEEGKLTDESIRQKLQDFQSGKYLYRR